MSSSKKIRVLVAKPGLDGHDRGAKIVARDEGVHCIGLSILSGAHNALFPKIMELLKKEGIDDVLVVGGGIIPEDDVIELKKAGIAAIFGPGTPLDEIVEYIKANVKL